MKGIIVIGWFIGMICLTMNGPSIQKSWKESREKTMDVVNQGQSRTSITETEFVANQQSLEKEAKAVPQFFTQKEHISLTIYLSQQELVGIPELGDSIDRNPARTFQLPAVNSRKESFQVPINSAFTQTYLSPQSQLLVRRK